MTSTSDDRSVRFWDLNFDGIVDWKTCQIKKSKSLYGHTARIFNSKIIEDGKFFFLFIKCLSFIVPVVLNPR